MSTTLRTPESYLDEVAQERGFKDVSNFFAFCAPDVLYLSTIEAINRILEDAFKARKDTQTAYHQLFGFGIGCTSEINDLLGGLSLTKEEWEEIKNNGGVPTLLCRHVNAIENHINKPLDNQNKN